MRLSEFSEAYRNATPEEKREFVELILPELVKNPELNNHLDNRMIISDLKPIKRISELEKITGLFDFEEEEDHDPTIPEKLSILSEKIENITTSNHIVYKEPVNIIPETKTEARAAFLIEYLENEVKEKLGQISLNGNELKDFIIKIIPQKNPELAPKPGQNIRKVKKDMLDKVKDLFGNKIEVVPNKHGRHETRILLKSYRTVTS